MAPAARITPGTLTPALLLLLLLLLLVAFGAPPARADIAHCVTVADPVERLACYDALAARSVELPKSAARDDAVTRLAEEFRFDGHRLMTGPLSFSIRVSGALKTNRDTRAVREVTQLTRRIARALDGLSGWRLAVTVHGTTVEPPREQPFTTDELYAQARAGMAATALSAEQWSVVRGRPAEPALWDDGRLRDANENITIDVVGFEAGGS
ncbi:MAG: hypothetical protein FJX53_00720 [Alphaproteobacteria bacterium]|nr:hypothetical protein [Alphaproteobacteria bacterium]